MIQQSDLQDLNNFIELFEDSKWNGEKVQCFRWAYDIINHRKEISSLETMGMLNQMENIQQGLKSMNIKVDSINRIYSHLKSMV